MERIIIEIAWDAPDGTLEDLENTGGDITLIKAALAAAERHRDGDDNGLEVDSSCTVDF